MLSFDTFTDINKRVCTTSDLCQNDVQICSILCLVFTKTSTSYYDSTDVYQTKRCKKTVCRTINSFYIGSSNEFASQTRQKFKLYRFVHFLEERLKKGR